VVVLLRHRRPPTAVGGDGRPGRTPRRLGIRGHVVHVGGEGSTWVGAGPRRPVPSVAPPLQGEGEGPAGLPGQQDPFPPVPRRPPRRRAHTPDPRRTMITVAVLTVGRLDYLRQTLASLAEQVTGFGRVVIFDDSGDRTVRDALYRTDVN